MTDEAKKLLLDVLTACQAIERFAAGRNFAEYQKAEQFRSATERKFEIVGKALSRLARQAPDVIHRFPKYPPSLPSATASPTATMRLTTWWCGTSWNRRCRC
jgi:hypothetical protein